MPPRELVVYRDAGMIIVCYRITIIFLVGLNIIAFCIGYFLTSGHPTQAGLNLDKPMLFLCLTSLTLRA